VIAGPRIEDYALVADGHTAALMPQALTHLSDVLAALAIERL
jgi:hypothetical protein